jgi:hypothetical protein
LQSPYTTISASPFRDTGGFKIGSLEYGGMKPGHKLQAAQLAHPQGASRRNHHSGNCVKLFDINVGAVAGQKFYFRNSISLSVNKLFEWDFIRVTTPKSYVCVESRFLEKNRPFFATFGHCECTPIGV